MSDYTIGNGTIKNIANAIRAQEGSSANIQVSNFASRILALTPTTKKTGDISNQNTKFYGITANTISAIGNAIKTQDGLTSAVSGFAQRILDLNNTDWKRPVDWPNYNFVDRVNEEEVMYFTIDVRNEQTSPTFSLKLGLFNDAESENYSYYGTFNLQKGYIDSTGFHSTGSASTTVPLNEGDYVVYKATVDSPKKIAHYSFGSDMTAKVVEIWGHTRHLTGWTNNYIKTTLVSWDLLCEGYLRSRSPQSHFIKRPMWGYTSANYSTLEHINFDGINWDGVIAYWGEGGNFNMDNCLLYCKMKTLDFTRFANKTLVFPYYSSGYYDFLFARMRLLEEVIVPTITLDMRTAKKAIDGFFAGNVKLITLDLSKLTILYASTVYQAGSSTTGGWFQDCSELVTLYCPTVTRDGGGGIDWSRSFWHLPKCEEIYNVPDVNYVVSGGTVYFAGSPKLSRDTMLRFFNKISNGTSTLMIESEVNNRLTAADIAILTNKGHTLSVVTSS